MSGLWEAKAALEPDCLPLAAPLSTFPRLNRGDKVFMGSVRGLDDTEGLAHSRLSVNVHLLHVPPNA